MVDHLTDVVSHLAKTVSHWANQPLTCVLLTLAVYQLSSRLYQHFKQPSWLHPVGISAIAMAVLINALDIPYQHYYQSTEWIHWLLGPATVALAIPLHQQFRQIRQLTRPVLVTVLSGAILAPVIAIGIAWSLGASDLTLTSLAPKSVTTPIAMGISESIGGLPELTTGVVVFTGVIGVMLSGWVFRLTGLREERLQGIVLGINAHGVGTARGFELGRNSGTFASLSMGLTGTFTALTLPYLFAL